MISGISVIICCYNSAKRLPDTLKHLAGQQKVTDLNWELIIIDNNCTDDTALVAIKEWKKYALDTPLNIFVEKKAGLKEARRCGVMQAKYDIILFCDDDNWLNSNYLEIVFHKFLNNNKISIIGGKGEAVTEDIAPEWFNQFKSYYAIGAQATKTGFLNKERKFVYGAGMAIRKEVLQKIELLKYDSPLTDRKGKDLTSGGDVEICYLANKLSYNIYYDDELIFKHFISKERLSWEYLERLFKGFALADSFLSILYLNLTMAPKDRIIAYRFKEIFSYLRVYKLEFIKYLFFRKNQSEKHLYFKYYLRQLKYYLFNYKLYRNYIRNIASI